MAAVLLWGLVCLRDSRIHGNLTTSRHWIHLVPPAVYALRLFIPPVHDCFVLMMLFLDA